MKPKKLQQWMGSFFLLSAWQAHAVIPTAYSIQWLDVETVADLHQSVNFYGTAMNAADGVVGTAHMRNVFSPENLLACNNTDGFSLPDCYFEDIESPFVAQSITTFTSSPSLAVNFQPVIHSDVDNALPVKGWDPNSADAPSSQQVPYGIENTIMVGEVVAKQAKGTTTDKYTRAWERRGFVQNGANPATLLEPEPASTSVTHNGITVNVGGYSVATAISGNWVAGQASIGITDAGTEIAKNCIDSHTTAEERQNCVQSALLLDGTNQRRLTWHRRAYLWDVTTLLTPVAQPLEFPAASEFPNGELPNESLALAHDFDVANNIAVGNSSIKSAYKNDVKKQLAAFWRDANLSTNSIEFVYEPEDTKRSDVYSVQAVSSDVLMAGAVIVHFEGAERRRGFYYVRPPTPILTNEAKKANFYWVKGYEDTNLQTRIRDINRSGLMVGSMEVQSKKSTSYKPHLHGMLIDINTVTDSSDDEVIDLNSRLTCDAKGLDALGNRKQVTQLYKGQSVTFEEYVMINQAIQIQDSGKILVQATVIRPKLKRLNEGTLLQNAKEIITAFVDPSLTLSPDEFESVQRTAILDPVVGGTACTFNQVDTPKLAASYKRQGASMWILPLLMSGLLFWRRRQR
jgi:hypothetical protein